MEYRLSVIKNGKVESIKNFKSKKVLERNFDTEVVKHNGNKKPLHDIFSKRILIENALEQIELIAEIVN